MIDEIKTQEISDEEVSLENLNYMIQFARELESGFYRGVLTPDLINTRMKDLSYNPVAPLQADLDRALVDPKNNETQLRQFGQSFELTSQSYKRLISYLGNLLAFDYTYTSNAEPEDYNTPAYKKDLARVWDFFDKFNVKQEFSTVVKQLVRNEAYFFAFRQDGDKYVLQELDSNYCKITAKFDYGLLYSYNFYYFMQPGVDIDMFPPFFREKFAEMFSGKQKQYIPDLPVDMRGNSSWVYWQDIPPDVGFCFKLSPENITRLPYFTPLFSDLILQPLMRLLQKNKSIASASKIVFGEVPMLNKDAKTTVKDMFALDAKSLANFLTLLKSGVGEVIRVAGAPLNNVRGISFPAEEDIYQQFLSNSVASSGVNSNLIFTSATRPNIMETQLSLATDEQLMESIYPQFNNFLDFRLNRLTKKFKFSVVLEGTNFFTNRTQRLEPLQTLLVSGIVLPQKLSAALGIEPHKFQRMMEEGKAMDFVGKLTPVIPGTNLAAGNQGAGRPAKSEDDLSDEGAQTRSDGGNIAKGGKK